MRLDIHHSIAICVDVQERLFPLVYQHEEIEQRIIMLIKGLAIVGVPVIVTQQYTNGLGPTIPSVAEAVGPFVPIEKITFSCCGSDAVEAIVLGGARHCIVLFGIETHVCVLQTALDLLAQGQKVVVVEDCVSSRRQNDKHIAIERLRHAGAVISTAESLLFEYLGKAGTDTFKAISALVK